MGRPKEHDEETRAALRAAAERLVAAGGADALSVRTAAARRARPRGPSTASSGRKRASSRRSPKPCSSTSMTRSIACPRPTTPPPISSPSGRKPSGAWLSTTPGSSVSPSSASPGCTPIPVSSPREKAWVQLQAAVQRLKEAGLLGTKPVSDAAREINAMWEGLANAELRGEVLRIMPKGEEKRGWHDALTTVVRGFMSTQPTPPRRRSRTNR